MSPPTSPASPSPDGAHTADHALVPHTGYPAPALAAAAPRPAISAYRRYVTFLARKWWIVLVCVLLFAGLAAAYVVWWPESYAATGHMWASGRGGFQLREGMTMPEDNTTFAGTQIELLQSDFILSRAATKVQDSLHISFPRNSDGDLEPPSVKVIQLPRSAVLRIKVKGRTELIAREFLNALMDEFLAYKREVRASGSGETYTSVSDETKRQEAELNTAEEKLTAYRRSNDVAVLEEGAKGASVYLSQLRGERSELDLQYQVLEAISGEGPSALSTTTNGFAGVPDLQRIAGAVVPSANPSQDFLLIQQELKKDQIMRANLSKNLRPAHPKIVKLDQKIAEEEKLVEFITRQNRDQLANLRQTVKLKLDRVQVTIGQFEGLIKTNQEHIAEFERLKLIVDHLQELRAHLLELLQTVDVSKNLDQENINILDRASQAKDAKMTLIVAPLLVIAGLAFGLGLVFLVEQTDDRLMSAEEVTHRFDEWVVGQIPEVARQRKQKRPALISADDRRHIFVESHRSIRSALWFATSREERPKLILVTSAIPQEGKTTLAANLARTMAFAGARTLLIDADLRRGTLHELFELPMEPGLGDLLEREGDLPFYLAPTSVPNLTLMPRGKELDNAGELLLGPGCERLLARVRKDFDCVIVDSIPIFAADDTTSLAPKMDGVILVVREGFTSAETARHALDMLYERQTKVLGLVVNRADTSARSYRYYKYGEYYRSNGKKG